MSTLPMNHYINVANTLISAVMHKLQTAYVFVAKPTPWADANGNSDDTTVPPTTNSVFDCQLSIYNDLAYGKLLVNTDISFLISNYTWTNNTPYARYDQDDPNLFIKNFFVVTNEYNVYKCIDNNYGANSIIQPNVLTTNGIFSTSDGYTWKYMFTVDPTSNVQFTTSSFIPVTVNNSVKNSAIGGTIDVIDVISGGNNYRTYLSGNLSSYVNNSIFTLPANASSQNDFYTGSSLYINPSFGAGQISKIIGYNGLSKTAVVQPPFLTYTYFGLANVAGSFNTGYFVSQETDVAFVLYTANNAYFNPGDTLLQSDTGANGQIITSNSSVIQIFRQSNTPFSIDLPILDTVQSGVLASGTVTIANGSANVTPVSGTAFVSDYAIGDYIRIGANSAANIRRVTLVNSSVIIVDNTFSHSLSANVHYKSLYAFTPSSIQNQQANGFVKTTNLNGVELTFANVTITGLSFFIGEIIDMVDINGNIQPANGIVSYSNSSTIIMSDVNGSFNSSLYIRGESTLQSAKIVSITSLPNITLSSPQGTFLAGQKVYSFDPLTLSPLGNATLIQTYNIPNGTTPFIISPTVKIDGDGQGALAYSTINTNPTTGNAVASIVVINSGNSYTQANISLTANNLFGNGAVLNPIIAPITGHGFDPTNELGARNVGVTMTFDVGSNESYLIPSFGHYRKIGIMINPLYYDLAIDVNTYDRVKLTTNNATGAFQTNEIVLQPASNTAGVVVFSNTSFTELKNVTGTFAVANSLDPLIGLISLQTSNVSVANVSVFSIVSNVEFIEESDSIATAEIVQVVNTSHLRLSNVSGVFSANAVIFDPVSNAYANVVNLYTANNTFNVTSTFGRRFNQFMRLPLSTTSGNFTLYETVIQNVTNASGTVVNIGNNVNISYTSASGTFTNGDIITQGGTVGVVVKANSTYLCLTSVNGNFITGSITNTLAVTATAANVIPVLMLSNIKGTNVFQESSNLIIGQVSGAMGQASIQGSIVYPDLVRNSGQVIYYNNLLPFLRSNTSQEIIKLVISF